MSVPLTNPHRWTKDKRIRGSSLQKIRREHFARHPLCVACEAKGRVRLATELDHTDPLHKGGADTPDNRAGLCHDCHAEKSASERGYRPAVRIGLDGFPVD